jgi:hypothetical protein
MKTKASESGKLQGRAGLLYLLGVRDGSRDCLLEAARRGFNSPHVQPVLKIFPVSGSSHSRGLSSDMSQGQGLKPAVILALSPKESKSQHDLPQLQNAMR